MSIFEWLTDLAGIETPSLLEVIFVSSAILGGILFFIMMILMLVGDILGGVGEAVGFDADIGTDLGFEMLSIQGLSVAVMMFGLTGMFGLAATDNDVIAVLFGGAGAASGMYGMAQMMRGISHLQADGTMNYDDAIGQRGQVYSRIRPNESGEVQIPLGGSLKNVIARSKDKTLLIPSGEFIKVIDRIGSTMIVIPLDDASEE